MIPVTEAIKHIENHFKPLEVISKPISKALDFVLAQDVLSPINMPPFKQSSMDGYAFKHSDKTTYTVIGEVQAGASNNIELNANEAVRIFTGARVPDQADTVVMQEHVSAIDKALNIDTLPQKFANVRLLGEQIKVDDVALKKGTVLNAASIGFLAGLGIPTVNVYKIPKVYILVTGNELQQLGNTLKEGQVYESNSITLKLALKKTGVKNIKILRVEDHLDATIKAIGKCLKKADVVLISGGISVGDYDFVKQALQINKVNEVFYKVIQKPGKPLWFGYKGQTKVVALPGNPASSLSCFYVYVLPLIRALMGKTECHLPRLQAKAESDIKNNFKKTLFLKGIVKDGQATALTGQASSMLKSFAIANALLVVPEETDIIKKGDTLTYLKL